MTTNDSKSYLSYLNKLLDYNNNAYRHSIGRKPINVDYSALTEKIEANPKAPKFKVNDRVRITKYKNIFSKGFTDSWSREIFIIDSVLKTNPWSYKIKDLNGEKIIGSVMRNQELLKFVPDHLKIKKMCKQKFTLSIKICFWST